MFKLNEKYETIRNILKYDYIRYSPFEICTIKTPNSQTYINIHREDSVDTASKRFLDLNFDVLNSATNKWYADNDDIRLVNLGPNALFSKYKLTSSSEKHLENIEHALVACLVFTLLTTARGCDDLSIGFDCSRDRRQQGLTNNEITKGKNHFRISLKDIYGIPEHQKKPLMAWEID